MREDIAISSTKFNILKWLSYYRGLTADQLAKLIYCTNSITVSNSKSMYNQLKKLEDIGLVKRYRAHPKISKFSIYYLSAKGLEFIQMKLNIWDGIRERGWITNQDYLKLGYFKYDTYKPPFKQMTHHLFVADILITCYLNDVCHRNNLYASRLSKDNTLLRPDAEMKINTKHYLIEIDNGTENHQQLIEKFNRYFHYVASTRDNKDIDVIVFIIDTKHSEQLNRRWISILAAFHIAMRRIYNLVELVLVTKEEFPSYILFEKNRPDLFALIAKHLYKKWDFDDDSLIVRNKHYYSLTDKDKYINYYFTTSKYSSYFVDLNPEISFIGYFTDTEPIIYTDLTPYRDVPSEIIEKYQKISKNLYLERIIF